MTGARLGIVGGLGPLAGAHFYRRLIELTPAEVDEDHLAVVLISQPSIPSRRKFLADQGPSPAPALQQVVRELESLGCDLIAIPSSTTHAFYDDMAAAVHTPILHLLAEVAAALRSAGAHRPAMLATQATIDTGIYQPHFRPDLRPLYPPPTVQNKIEALINAVKRGDDVKPLSAEISNVVSGPWTTPADSVLLACTETPLITPTTCSLPIFSATDILARAVLKRLRPEHSPATQCSYGWWT
ncbi:aspartate/glutamate racemase family protein [Leekyejoonella antrihumi]|uniref:Aspartate/glutamate racemase family protein n=1 Tax=Leekyejoonella antrihumi TaxID=1660198 RepID=A0A563DWV6_9MICO|nr:amino acid racemase [Leekyejoonella antrihumi]TWP34451.1 aspartate/glutamate racemase family protein [Leekyejoonella antrihumi]